MAHFIRHRQLFAAAVFVTAFSFTALPATFTQAHETAETAIPATLPNTAYSNLETANFYSPFRGLAESGGTTGGKSTIYAMAFQVDSSYTYYMSQVNVALNLVSGPNKVNIVFAQDNGGVPGAIISEVSATISSTYPSCCSLTSVAYPHSNQNHIVLAPATTYWIETIIPEGEIAVWNTNAEMQGGAGAVSRDGGTTWTSATLPLLGGFSVYGYILIQG